MITLKEWQLFLLLFLVSSNVMLGECLIVKLYTIIGFLSMWFGSYDCTINGKSHFTVN